MLNIDQSQNGPIWNGPLEKFWNHADCDQITAKYGLDLLACKNKCLTTKRCTAFNFKSKTGGCALRACDLPIPAPSDGPSDWEGYYYEPGMQSLELQSRLEFT